MKKNFDDVAQKMYYISRSIPVLMVMCILLAGVTKGVILYLELKPIWLVLLGKAFFIFEFSILVISLAIPGFLVILGYPKLAYAWIRGALRNLSTRLWEQLSNDEKKLIYTYSFVPLVLLLLGAAILILQYF